MPRPLLLVFAHSAQTEAGRKKFGGTYNSRRRAFKNLNSHTATVGHTAGLPVMICDERSQQGNSFGEKLANALEVAFDKGHDEVIVIGNDCPALNSARVAEAVEALQSAPLVVGPDYRGGVYLIGLRRSAFHKKSFEGLGWQSAALNHDLCAYSKTCVSLRPLHDINTGRDILFAVQELDGGIELRRILFELLAVKQEIYFSLSRQLLFLERDALLLRGPPVLF